MLTRLYVKNVALIDEADIGFGNGLNVLSGETGSGKSVILDSVNFVLGSKADRTMIRYGAQEALVRAEFCIDKNSLCARKLEEYDIETDGTVVISRRLNIDGRGAIKINGNSVTATMLKSVTQNLVDVHGQSEHFFLLDEDNQLKVIDRLCGDRAEEIKKQLSEIIDEKRKLKAAVSALGGNESERARKLDLLEYQINEIEAADIKAGESDELKARRKIIINLEKIVYAINAVKSILNDDGGCGDGITSALHEMNKIADFDSAYADVVSRLENISADIGDVAETLSDLGDGLSFDQSEAQAIDERLSLIKNLQKKYGADEDSVLRFKDEAKREYELLNNSVALIENYSKQSAECEDKIYKLCVELTELRKETAKNFGDEVTEQLKSLNIPDAKFSVRFNSYDRTSADYSSYDGSDKICFEFSANKGEPLKPLSKVISGGEMSRFMIALKIILKNLNGISTYIFDEIDAGISGQTAVAVAEKLIEISAETQIIAVSHLPQVCAASDVHFLIYKITEENGKTYSRVKKLSDVQKVEEIVRLTGNVSSKTAVLHAEELIEKIKFRK